MQLPEEEAEAGPGFEAPAGCGGGGYPPDEPPLPSPPLPAASAARPGAGSRGRAGSPGRPAAATQETVRDAAARDRSPRPARRRGGPGGGGWDGGACTPRRADAVELKELLAGVKAQNGEGRQQRRGF